MTDENKDWERAEQYVKDNAETLRNKHGNNYLAVHPEGRIIDSDEHEGRLAEKVCRAFPNENILIGNIGQIVGDNVDFIRGGPIVVA